MSELKELLAGFNHEKTNLEAVSKYLCDQEPFYIVVGCEEDHWFEGNG